MALAAEKISALEQKFQDEWLLIEVREADADDQPLAGVLLGHSKSREGIHQIVMATRERGHRYYLTYTGDPIPPDLAVVL
jgi:hypothetical protein